MRKILIATHATYAEGIRAAAELILGPQPEITTICAYTEGVILEKALEEYFEACMPEDEVVVLTDIYGGSVNQACMKYMERSGVHLLTGANLALLLQVITMEEGEELQEAVNEAKEQISYVNETMTILVNDDFADL